MLSNVEVQLAPKQSIEKPKPEDDRCALLDVQIKRLEIRLSRVRAAYEDGIDTLEEYKENKTNIIESIEKLKKELELEKQQGTGNNSSVKIDTEKFARLTDILKNESVSNSEKNKTARIIFKEILKGGGDGKTLKCVFWE